MTVSQNFETILMLLEAGADYRIVNARDNRTVAHHVAMLPPPHTPESRAYYDKLVNWLADRDISVERANAQLETWRQRTKGKVLGSLTNKDIFCDDIPEGSQAAPPGPSTLTKERWDEYVNNAP